MSDEEDAAVRRKPVTEQPQQQHVFPGRVFHSAPDKKGQTDVLVVEANIRPCQFGSCRREKN